MNKRISHLKKIHKSHMKIFIMMFVLFLINLSGCSLFHADTKLNGKIDASTRLNPDLNHRASPIVLSFYELKSIIPFKNLDFYKINNQAHRNLGSSLIDSSHIEIRPGEKRSYSKNLAADTKYVGITAAYRHLEVSKWKQIVAILPYSRRLKLLIYLNSQQLLVEKN